jgi:nicotinamide phosphoribosyltransferase
MSNLILATDSYKLTHWNQYPPDTTHVYSYLEARKGADFPETVFFGLQYILRKYLTGKVVYEGDVYDAQKLAAKHFGNDSLFNFDGWMYIARDLKGYLPIEIKAVPEGSVVDTGNVLMTIVNTDPKCYWLTNALESLLMHVWYPSTVASLSRSVKKEIEWSLSNTSDGESPNFMLHDFGYRGVSSHESAAIGGAGHLVNFLGTDTLPAMELLHTYYGASYDDLAFSVPATEHSVMTARGREGEDSVIQQLLDNHPTGILSVVADSYNVYDFAIRLGDKFKEQILARDGVFVVRPDSVALGESPASVVTRLLEILWKHFGGTTNSKGFRVLDPHIRLIWGDGIDSSGIVNILAEVEDDGYSAENLVFGMGGGLLQKVNRDTQRFAIKASAMKGADGWRGISKDPLDASKASKKGHLALVDGKTVTVPPDYDGPDDLELVFHNGRLIRKQKFSDIRARAAL